MLSAPHPNGCGNNHNDVDVHVARYYLPTCGHHLLGIAHPIIVLGFNKIQIPPIPSPNISINTSESTNVSSMYPSPGNNHVPSTHKIPWVQFPICHHSNPNHVAREINLLGSYPNTSGPNHYRGALLDHPKTPPNVSNITPLQIYKSPLQWLQILDMIHHGPPQITPESNQIITARPWAQNLTIHPSSLQTCP